MITPLADETFDDFSKRYTIDGTAIHPCNDTEAIKTNLPGGEMFDALCKGYSLDEIASGSYKDVKQPKHSGVGFCDDCRIDKIIVDEGVYVCPECGETEYGYVNEWDDEIWKHKKSLHSRYLHFRKQMIAGRYIESRYISMIADDFIRVVSVMIEHDLIKGKNVSKFAYYVIRLCSRRGIELESLVKDMKASKTRRVFDSRLFGEVYPLLGWDQDCGCPYYLKWLDEQ